MEKYALMAAASALAITAASGLLIIPALRRLHYGQTIKEIGPTWHQGKNGTPTMGGLTFYLGVLVGVVLGYTVLALSVPSLLGGWLSGTSVSLFIGVLTAYAFGLVGFVDDYIKVVKKRNLGLMARYKIVAQVLITGAYLSSLYLNGTLSTIVTLPLLGAVDFGWFFLRPLVPPHHRHGERRQPDGRHRRAGVQRHLCCNDGLHVYRQPFGKHYHGAVCRGRGGRLRGLPCVELLPGQNVYGRYGQYVPGGRGGGRGLRHRPAGAAPFHGCYLPDRGVQRCCR